MRPEAFGNRCPLNLGVLGDVKETLTALLPKITAKSDRSFCEHALDDYARARKELDSLAELMPTRAHSPAVRDTRRQRSWPPMTPSSRAMSEPR